MNTRSGRLVRQPAGYQAFVPVPLPPDPDLQIDAELLALLSRADQAVARLDGISSTLQNPDLFVAMYVRQEAVLSSQIEGTQSSLDDVLEFEADPNNRSLPPDVTDVVNYVRAMNYGLLRLDSLPLSLRLIREIHAILLEDTRGADKQPGEFRLSQNWIGPPGATLAQASFVPPPPTDLLDLLGEFESYLHSGEQYPILIHTGLVHAQFETIHPFLDGNGRIGRLLITFLLCHHGVLRRPLLYLSSYLKLHRAEYYDRLTAIRTSGDWEGWLRYYLLGVARTAEQATHTARAINDLRDQHRVLLSERGVPSNGYALFDQLFSTPVINARGAEQLLNVSYPTANNLLKQFTDLGILKEITGRERDRLYRYDLYLELFRQGASEPADDREDLETRDLDTIHQQRRQG